jgi:hypothetical protein
MVDGYIEAVKETYRLKREATSASIGDHGA